MARVDKYLVSLQRLGASSMVLQSGSNVCLHFPTGQRFANQVTPHAELVAMVQEIAPRAVWAIVERGAPTTLDYTLENNAYRVEIQPGAESWKVTFTPRKSASRDDITEEASSKLATSESRDVSNDKTLEFRKAPNKVQTPSPRATPPAFAGQQGSKGHAAITTDSAPKYVEKLLIQMKQLGASDLHLSSGNRPYVRLHGEMKTLDDFPVLEEDELLRALLDITPEKYRLEFQERNDADFAILVPDIARFRANLFRDRRGPGAVFRVIPFNILTPEQLGLPKAVLDLCFLTKGIVVVTGPTGSGKSTTLAALIDHINRNRSDHLITIEDPIEFVHDNKKCLVNQREIHTHTRSFKDALRAALREDPDIILVGEMRDLETISIAIETAETGHLVWGTLHTTTAASTVDRMIDQFPADRQEQIRQMLSESLRGVIAQTLCKKIGGGRVAAYEILLGSTAVSNLIREKKTFQLPSVMQTSRAQGMVTLNDSLIDLVKREVVEAKEAYMKSVNKSEFKSLLSKEGITLALS